MNRSQFINGPRAQQSAPADIHFADPREARECRRLIQMMSESELWVWLGLFGTRLPGIQMFRMDTAINGAREETKPRGFRRGVA